MSLSDGYHWTHKLKIDEQGGGCERCGLDQGDARLADRCMKHDPVSAVKGATEECVGMIPPAVDVVRALEIQLATAHMANENLTTALRGVRTELFVTQQNFAAQAAAQTAARAATGCRCLAGSLGHRASAASRIHGAAGMEPLRT